MPRTKAVRKKTKQALNPEHAKLIQEVERFKEYTKEKMENAFKNFLSNLKTEMHLSKLSIPMAVSRKTTRELMDLPLNWSGNNTAASVQVLELTKTQLKNRIRSSSAGEDEGDRKSRPRGRTSKTLRSSRSASTRQTVTRTVTKYKTPNQRIPVNCYATITPKLKPNTPQVLLRRPKQGEVALSLQGSPLLTGNVISDNVANINIPLEDGRCISIQPQRGLRISQIPELDLETKRQLEMLRDNLTKVCLANNR